LAHSEEGYGSLQGRFGLCDMALRLRRMAGSRSATGRILRPKERRRWGGGRDGEKAAVKEVPPPVALLFGMMGIFHTHTWIRSSDNERIQKSSSAEEGAAKPGNT